MKTIGMIGGMSWESSLEYYRLLNTGVKSALGGLHSAKTLMYSVDFEEIEALQHKEDWGELSRQMTEVAIMLENAGADMLMICTNTMHKMADDVQKNIGIPLLHIADAAAEEIKRRGFHTVGLLGTRFTMEQDFYRGRLKDRHGIDVIIPESSEMDIVHSVIYNELCLGELKDKSRDLFRNIISELEKAGAEGLFWAVRKSRC